VPLCVSWPTPKPIGQSPCLWLKRVGIPEQGCGQGRKQSWRKSSPVCVSAVTKKNARCSTSDSGRLCRPAGQCSVIPSAAKLSGSRAQSASCRNGPSNSSQRGYFRVHDWPRPWLGERGSALAGLAEIACDPGGGAGAGQFVGGRHPHLPEEFTCTITRGELAVWVVVIRDNVEAHHNRC
jgi:hypothetical protein